MAAEKAAKEQARLEREANEPAKAKKVEEVDPTKYYENRSSEILALKN